MRRGKFSVSVALQIDRVDCGQCLSSWEKVNSKCGSKARLAETSAKAILMSLAFVLLDFSLTDPAGPRRVRRRA